MLATVLDRKTGKFPGSGGTLYNRWHADIVSTADYYPGGMIMPGRYRDTTWSRMGSQSQEKDDEVYGKGNLYAFKYRLQDARLVRFFSVDPLAAKYPYYSAYQFAGNTTIQALDLEGLEPANANLWNKPGVSTVLSAEDAENVQNSHRSFIPVVYTPGSFDDWNETNGRNYDTRIEAYRAWQSDPNYHKGESKFDKIMRSMAAASMEERRDFAAGGYNMYGGFRSSIARAGKVLTSSDALVTRTANAIEKSSPGLVRAVEALVENNLGQVVSDFDIVLEKHIIEVCAGSGTGKTAQVLKRLIPNAGNKEVILFGPKIGGAVERALTAKGVKVFRSTDELLKYIQPKGKYIISPAPILRTNNSNEQ